MAISDNENHIQFFLFSKDNYDFVSQKKNVM